MTGTLKERMSRIANLIGAISFGILVSRYASNFPRIHIFIFFYFNVSKKSLSLFYLYNFYNIPLITNFAVKVLSFSNFKIPFLSSNFPVQSSKSEIPYQGSMHTNGAFGLLQNAI